MRKNKLSRDLVLLLVTTLITIGCWIAFEVYRAYNQVVLPAGVERHLIPLDPNLDKNVLEIISDRR